MQKLVPQKDSCQSPQLRAGNDVGKRHFENTLLPTYTASCFSVHCTLPLHLCSPAAAVAAAIESFATQPDSLAIEEAPIPLKLCPVTVIAALFCHKNKACTKANAPQHYRWVFQKRFRN